MNNLIAVFLGGGLGAISRYALSLLLPLTKANAFPWATFSANIAASIILGLLVGISLRSELDHRTQLFLMVGFCGGFSTFSTFSKEVFTLFEQEAYTLGITYALSSVVVCVFAVALGYWISNN